MSVKSKDETNVKFEKPVDSIDIKLEEENDIKCETEDIIQPEEVQIKCEEMEIGSEAVNIKIEEVNNYENEETVEERKKQLSKLQSECSSLFKTIKSLETTLDEFKQQYTQKTNALSDLKRIISNRSSKAKIRATNRTLQSTWVDNEFAWSKTIKQLLNKKFKFPNFRSRQLAAINATLSKIDVLLVMPTGGGKSLVYQLPALIDKGFTLVVSPLIALMEDQLIGLSKLGIGAATINSGNLSDKTKDIYEKMIVDDEQIKLLYVTPEWLAKSKKFMSVLKESYKKGLLARVAIDEVHCCSTWGHDFRPEYKYLGILRSTFVNTPFIGLTATASISVLSDIQKILGLEDCLIITSPMNRPNLYFKVMNKPTSKDDAITCVENFLKKDYNKQSGIIYATTINDCMNLTEALKKRNLKVAPYHGQLEMAHKKRIHSEWLNKNYQAVVATVAFGMGIDKPDVRFVIHYSIPKSMENLYQESGRAGRDGKKADCIILFSLNDYLRVSGMVTSISDDVKAHSVLEYCLDQKTCRRALIANQFDEDWNANVCNKMCDHCETPASNFVYYDITDACKDLQALIKHAESLDSKLTITKLLDIWFQINGKAPLRIPTLTKPKITREKAEYIVSYLLLNKYLSIDKGYTQSSVVCYFIVGKDVDKKIELFTHQKLIGFKKRYHDDCEPLTKKIKVEN